MKGITRLVLVPVFAGYALVALGLLLFNIITADPVILPQYAWNYIFLSVADGMMAYFVPVTVAGFLLGFSVFINAADMRTMLQGEHSFVKVAGKAVVFVLLLASVYVAMTGFAAGQVRQERERLAGNSARARAYYTEARDLYKKGLATEARERIDLTLRIADDFLPARELHDKLYADMEIAAAAETAAPGHASAGHAEMTAGAGESAGVERGRQIKADHSRSLVYEDEMNRAREFLELGDAYTALYYVQRARAAGDAAGIRADAVWNELNTTVLARIRGTVESSADAAKRALYEDKRLAIVDLLQTGQTVEAYYKLLEIEASVSRRTLDEVARAVSEANLKDEATRREQPDAAFVSELTAELRDSDVRRWLPRAYEALKSQVLYREDVEALLDKASGEAVMFLNRDADGVRQYVYARDLVAGEFNHYLVAPEIIDIDKAGRVLRHRVAEYGKMAGKDVILRTLGRSDPTRSSGARMLVGVLDEAERDRFRLELDPDAVWRLSESRAGYRNMGAPEVFGLMDVADKAGYDVLPLHAVLLSYGLQVLSFPSFCFFAMAWGWANRNRALTRPIPLMALMIVLVPPVLHVAIKAYWYVGSCLNASLLIGGGFSTALTVLIAVQVVQLVASLVYMAGQSTD